MHPEDEDESTIAFVAKKKVARCFGFWYTASRYTFSPPERGNIVPSSSQMNRPQTDKTKPSSHSMSDAPTDPTDPKIEDGVEKMPVPMVAPMLHSGS